MGKEGGIQELSLVEGEGGLITTQTELIRGVASTQTSLILVKGRAVLRASLVQTALGASHCHQPYFTEMAVETQRTEPT